MNRILLVVATGLFLIGCSGQPSVPEPIATTTAAVLPAPTDQPPSPPRLPRFTETAAGRLVESVLFKLAEKNSPFPQKDPEVAEIPEVHRLYLNLMIGHVVLGEPGGFGGLFDGKPPFSQDFNDIKKAYAVINFPPINAALEEAWTAFPNGKPSLDRAERMRQYRQKFPGNRYPFRSSDHHP